MGSTISGDSEIKKGANETIVIPVLVPSSEDIEDSTAALFDTRCEDALQLVRHLGT